MEDITNDIEVEKEYDTPLVENINIGNVDGDDKTNDEVNIVQQDKANETYVNPMMVLSQQVNMNAARDENVINLALNNIQELYVRLRFNDKNVEPNILINIVLMMIL